MNETLRARSLSQVEEAERCTHSTRPPLPAAFRTRDASREVPGAEGVMSQ